MPARTGRQLTAHTQVGAHHGYTASNAIARDQAAGEVAEIGSEKWHPCKKGDALKAEPAGITQVLG